MKALVAVGALLATACAKPATPRQPALEPTIFDFEQDAIGETPAGWVLGEGSGKAGFSAATVSNVAASGKRSVLLQGSSPDSATSGVLALALDAAPYRGTVVRYRASVRTDMKVGTTAHLWMRVDRAGGRVGFFDNMNDRAILGEDWAVYEITGPVARDADKVSFGLLLIGSGKAWLDDVHIEVVATMPEPEQARPLSGRSLANLVAFTRLLGYVRFFHPSDQAVAADWNAFAIRGVRAIEDARSPQETAERLQRLFADVAPTLRVFPGDASNAKALPAELRRPTKKGRQVLMWEHHGFAQERQRLLYWKQRLVAGFDGRDLPPPFLNPWQPLVVELGGGVSASLPISLFADGDGTLPHGPASQPQSGDPELTRLTTSLDDRATRLAAVALTWSALQHFYPYFDVVSADWATALEEALQAAATDEDDEAFAATLGRLMHHLHDGHGFVRTQGRFGSEVAALPCSLGVVEGQLVVLRVEPKAAALRPGDVISKIDGKPALDVLAEETRAVSAATPQHAEFLALASLSTGPRGSMVALDVLSPGGSPRSLTVTRGPPSADSFATENRPPALTELLPNVWYVDLERTTAAELDAVMPALASADAVVFDMRGYPTDAGAAVLRHLSDAAMRSPRWLVPVVTRPDREAWTFDDQQWTIHPQPPRIRGRVVFLTDGRAVSYAETIMSFVETYRLGEIVGGPTAGTNGNIVVLALPGGAQVAFTGMKTLKQDGSQHHGLGISPTVRVSRTIAGVAAGRDEILEAGCRVVGTSCP